MIVKRQKYYSELVKKKKLFGFVNNAVNFVKTKATQVGNGACTLGKVGLGVAGVAGVAGIAAASNLASGAEQGANNGI
jgi:tartrate dehydratase alpha subunit/fumarate hydratase class I-like protein